MNKKIVKKIGLVLVANTLLLPVFCESFEDTVAADSNDMKGTDNLQSVTKDEAIKAGQSLTKSEMNIANQYIKIVDNKYVLEIPDNSNLSVNTINKIKTMLTYFNSKVEQDGVILVPANETEDSQNYSSPFISFARRKKHHKAHRKSSHGYIVGYGSNGYCYKDSHGNFHYVVTKSPLQTVFDVSRHGWESALGGGWVASPENANWHGFKY